MPTLRIKNAQSGLGVGDLVFNVSQAQANALMQGGGAELLAGDDLPGALSLSAAEAKAVRAGLARDGTSGLYVLNGVLYFNGAYCRELGLNAYSAITTTLDGSVPSGYRDIIDGAVALGVRIIRVSITPYNNTQLSAMLFGGGAVRAPLSWASLDAAYRSTVQTVFDYAASKGVFLLATVIWAPRAWFDAFGEDRTVGMASKASKGRIAMRAMCSAFASAYKDHPALAGYTVANELALIDGTTIPMADAQATAAELAAAIRAHDPRRLIASSHLGPVLDLTAARPTFDAVIAGIAATNPDPLDVLDLHAYADRAWMSKGPELESMRTPSAEMYTYALEWMQRYVAAGIAAGKPSILTEIGVSTQAEVAGNSTKFAGLLDAVHKSGVQLALVWNYRDNVSGQLIHDIRDGTARGNAYLPLIVDYVKRFRASQPAQKGGKPFDSSAAYRPSALATFNGTNNVNLKHNGSAAFAGQATTVMLWARKDSTPAAFARLIDAREASNQGGWSVVTGADGTDIGFSINNTSAAEVVNTFGKLPATANGTLEHYAWTTDGASRIDIYKGGLWWDSKVGTYTSYAPKTAASGVTLGSATNGASPASVSMARVVIVPRVCTAREIADNYLRGTVPADAVVIPLDYDGRAVGAIEQAPASASGSVTFGAA